MAKGKENSDADKPKMKKVTARKIIYVDLDEEITQVYDRIKRLNMKEIYLVVPKRAILLQSVVNLKIMMKNTLIIFNFAFLIALSRAGKVSFAFPSPIPTCPFSSPITAIVEKVGTFPSFVFLCVCLQALLFPPPNFPFD